MSITKVKSKIKSKKFSKNGKNKTMKKNINKKRKTMIRGGSWWRSAKKKPQKPNSQHVTSQNFWKKTPLVNPNQQINYIHPSAKAQRRAALGHEIRVRQENIFQKEHLRTKQQKVNAAAAIRQKLQEKAIF